MLDGTAFFHSAMVVSDLDRSMAELAGTLGVCWASPMVFDTGGRPSFETWLFGGPPPM